MAANNGANISGDPMSREALGYDPNKGFGKLLYFASRNKGLTAGAMAVVVLIVAIFAGVNIFQGNKQAEEQAAIQEKIRQNIADTNAEATTGSGTDEQLLQSQDALTSSYGQAPEGYLWDWDGTLLSLGDTSMTAEEVLYSYLKGISTLDLATVQKYSRGSSVYKTYSAYFDEINTGAESGSTSKDFEKDLYRQAMLSLQADSIASSTLFTNNKVSFTVNVKMLDYSDKTFTDSSENRASIFETLDRYTNTEDDKVKAKQYLQDWLLDYYTSGKAQLYNKKIDITLQKYPDLNTGWLVCIDTDLDNDFKYSDGNGVYDYVMANYQDWYIDKVEQESREASEQAKQEVQSQQTSGQ